MPRRERVLRRLLQLPDRLDPVQVPDRVLRRVEPSVRPIVRHVHAILMSVHRIDSTTVLQPVRLAPPLRLTHRTPVHVVTLPRHHHITDPQARLPAMPQPTHGVTPCARYTSAAQPTNAVTASRRTPRSRADEYATRENRTWSSHRRRCSASSRFAAAVRNAIANACGADRKSVV